ncbi:MAG: hypothetical protein FGM42_05595 [Ilumatobacteraceae bacterium]|nr:hypothetical protein [Ilumatobacteraceae bacterium]
MITGVYIAAAAVCVFVIAAVVIGREARRLDAVAPRAVYDPDQAVEFVAEMLPGVTQARLTLDELGAMLTLHMRWLHAKGLQPDRPVDKRQDIDELLLISEDQLSAFLLSEAEKSGVELLDDVDVVHVVRAHLAYFDAIGAVGPTASSTDL